MKKDRNAKTKLLLADLKIPSSFTLPTDSGFSLLSLLFSLLSLFSFFFFLLLFFSLPFSFFLFLFFSFSLFQFLLTDRDLSSFVIDKCKAMVSAAAPIWLTFQSAEVFSFFSLSLFFSFSKIHIIFLHNIILIR